MRPLQDLKSQNSLLIKDFQTAFENFVYSGNYVSGALTEKFENDLAHYTGCKYVIAVNNGTSALEIALSAAGVLPGDYVAIPAITFVATAYAVISRGAIPVLVDIDPITWNISLQSIKDVFSKIKFRFIIPVHLHGQRFDVQSIVEFAKENKIIIIEDSAQSISKFSSNYNLATNSLAATTSFYPGKNLGSMTEGGAILTNSKKVARFARRYRNWGTDNRYEHDYPGGNFRISEFGSAILSIKLNKLDGYIKKRQENASNYFNQLCDIEDLALPSNANGLHSFHVYSIVTLRSLEIQNSLKKSGFQTGKHYPNVINENKFYRNCLVPFELKNATWFARNCLSLPMDELLTKQEINKICNVIRKCYEC